VGDGSEGMKKGREVKEVKDGNEGMKEERT
jgi:hypothetical protein